MSSNYFQVCQKLVIVSHDKTMVLLGKRNGESDYDGVFSFFGGKMETSDHSLIEGLRREKNEELGESCWINLYPKLSTNYIFHKNNGDYMVIPHYYAVFGGGQILISNEYSEYQWIHIDELDLFEPKISTIPEIVRKMLEMSIIIDEEDMIKI